MARFFHPLLYLIACATRQELARQVHFLKVENRILRARLPQRIVVRPNERKKLLKAAKGVGKAIRELTSIVSPKTFLRWMNQEPKGSVKPLPKRKPGRPKTPEEIRELVVNGVVDPDPGALRGMAIIGLSGTATGTWQYTINNGTNWSNILTTGSVNALLLSNNANTRIRYVPNPGFVGTALIAFVAWDQSQGVNGGTVNAGSRGGATAFSSLYEYASISITI